MRVALLVVARAGGHGTVRCTVCQVTDGGEHVLSKSESLLFGSRRL